MSIIVKILEQKILGYSKDLSCKYVQHLVLLDNGETAVKYSTYRVLENGMNDYPDFVDEKPNVEIKAK